MDAIISLALNILKGSPVLVAGIKIDPVESCPVCREETWSNTPYLQDAALLLPCKHIIHFMCLLRSIVIANRPGYPLCPSCPLCRYPVLSLNDGEFLKSIIVLPSNNNDNNGNGNQFGFDASLSDIEGEHDDMDLDESYINAPFSDEENDSTIADPSYIDPSEASTSRQTRQRRRTSSRETPYSRSASPTNRRSRNTKGKGSTIRTIRELEEVASLSSPHSDYNVKSDDRSGSITPYTHSISDGSNTFEQLAGFANITLESQTEDSLLSNENDFESVHPRSQNEGRFLLLYKEIETGEDEINRLNGEFNRLKEVLDKKNHKVIACYMRFGNEMNARKNEIKEEKSCSEAAATRLLNKEIKEQLEIDDDDVLYRLKEKAKKIYEFFSVLGEDKIYKLPTISADQIGRLSYDELRRIINNAETNNAESNYGGV